MWYVPLRSVVAVLAWYGKLWLDKLWHGKVRQLSFGGLRHGRVRFVVAVEVGKGLVRLVGVRQGVVRQSWQVETRYVALRRGKVWQAHKPT